jgi:hypothetical protein
LVGIVSGTVGALALVALLAAGIGLGYWIERRKRR